MGIHQALFGAGGALVSMGDIANSLRFRASAAAYLSKTPAVQGSLTTWSYSTWVKRGALTAQRILLYAATAESDRTFIDFNPTDNLRLGNTNANVTALETSNAVFRDPTAHMHILAVGDTSNAVAADRLRLYVNGVRLATTSAPPPLSSTTHMCRTISHNIGRNSAAGTTPYDGEMSRICLVDGQALDPSAFGYLNPTTGAWVTKSQAEIKALVETGGVCSYMLDFTDGSTVPALGNDLSTKNNDWTPTNFSLTPGAEYDWMLDTPSNNYATLDPVALPIITGTLIYANLRPGSPADATHNRWRTTIAASSGKWYFEGTPFTINASASAIGAIKTEDANGATYLGATAGGYSYTSGGLKANNASASAYGATYAAGDVIGVALDLDAGTLEFFKNNVSQGIAYSGLAGTFHFGVSAIGSGTLTSTWNVNFGQRPFVHTPPAGFNKLNTANLKGNGTVTVSGTFTGNANANGPFVWMNGVPTTLTINGNVVTFGTHADKTAGGFKLRTALVGYNAAGVNNWTATIVGNKENLFKHQNAKTNP